MAERTASEEALISFHASCCAECYEAWFGSDQDEQDLECQHTAALLLEHAGKLHRYTGDDNVLNGLFRGSPDDRKRLVRAACLGLSAADTVELMNALSKLDDLDEADMLAVERALQLRDSLDVVVSRARSIVWDSLTTETDFSLLRAIAHAAAQGDLLDKALQTIPEAVAAAMPALEGVRVVIKTGIDTSTQWWFQDARAIMDQAETRLIQMLQPRDEKTSDVLTQAWLAVRRLMERFRPEYPDTSDTRSVPAAISIEAFAMAADGPSGEVKLSVADSPELVVWVTPRKRGNEAMFEVRTIDGVVPQWARGGRICLASKPSERQFDLDEEGRTLIPSESFFQCSEGQISLRENNGTFRGHVVTAKA